MSGVTSKYLVTIYIRVEYEIVVHLGSNQKIKCTQCGNILYYFDTNDIGHAETTQDDITDDEKTDKPKISVTIYPFVSTVVSNKEYFN